MPFPFLSGRIHRALPAILAAALLLPAASTARVELARLWTGYRDARSFIRLSELFTGKENPGRTIILRSHPEDRSGFYYIIRLVDSDRGALPDGTVVVQLIPPDGEQPRTFRFPFKSGSRHKARLDVGITGEDWTYGETLPLAWKLDVLGPDGELLVSRQSFLWSRAPEHNS